MAGPGRAEDPGVDGSAGGEGGDDPAGRQFLKTGSMALEEWNEIGVASAMKMQQ